MFTATLFTIIKRTGNNPKVHQQAMEKQRVAHLSMEFYSAVQRSKLLLHKTRWMNVTIIMLKEKFPTQKSTYYMNAII